jgi:hypothetical protein
MRIVPYRVGFHPGGPPKHSHDSNQHPESTPAAPRPGLTLLPHLNPREHPKPVLPTRIEVGEGGAGTCDTSPAALPARVGSELGFALAEPPQGVAETHSHTGWALMDTVPACSHCAETPSLPPPRDPPGALHPGVRRFHGADSDQFATTRDGHEHADPTIPHGGATASSQACITPNSQ